MANGSHLCSFTCRPRLSNALASLLRTSLFADRGIARAERRIKKIVSRTKRFLYFYPGLLIEILEEPTDDCKKGVWTARAFVKCHHQLYRLPQVKTHSLQHFYTFIRLYLFLRLLLGLFFYSSRVIIIY